MNGTEETKPPMYLLKQIFEKHSALEVSVYLGSNRQYIQLMIFYSKGISGQENVETGSHYVFGDSLEVEAGILEKARHLLILGR
jgi:hypothetical protein